MEIWIICGIFVLIIGFISYKYLLLASDLIDLRSANCKLSEENISLKKEKAAPPKSIQAEQILHDLTRGEAVVRIVPINPSDVFLRSPR